MITKLAPGISLALKTIVRDSDSAKSHGSGLLDVYATPAMIGLMERTAMECVQNYLPQGHGTVGVSVQIKHLKASAPGASIECTATLKEVEDRLLRFDVEAREKDLLIGTGTHERFIIDEMKFMDNLKRR